MTHRDSANYSKGKLAVGYGVIALLIGAIVYLYISEWRQLEKLEHEAKHINMLRQKVHDAYAKMLDLTLYGEKVLEWNAEDTLVYIGKRNAMDSILCEFKQHYPPTRLDSLRLLLAEKEEHLFTIWRLYENQEKLNAQLATQIPIIANQSVQEQSQKKGGFLGLFKKKEKSATTTSKMLNSLNRDVVKQYQKQSQELSHYADSLAQHNTILNIRLQEIIRKLDARVQNDLQAREDVIVTAHKQCYVIICIATVFLLVLLAGLYAIIHKDALKIKKYKEDAARLIAKQNQMLSENTELLNARQKMMHTITHELRIPLSSIIGYNDLLIEETNEDILQVKEGSETITDTVEVSIDNNSDIEGDRNSEEGKEL